MGQTAGSGWHTETIVAVSCSLELNSQLVVPVRRYASAVLCMLWLVSVHNKPVLYLTRLQCVKKEFWYLQK